MTTPTTPSLMEDLDWLIHATPANKESLAEYRRLRAALSSLATRDATIAALRTLATTLGEALATWEEREAAVCPEDVGFAEYIGSLTSQRDAVLARSIKLEELVIWMSGSSDFSPGGQAHEGWLKAQHLLSTTHDERVKP